MQTNSQNSQNPGLWVNGNRMPVQESTSIGALKSLGKPLSNLINTAGKNLEGVKLFPQLDVDDVSVVQKRTEDQEAARQAVTAKANPDLADRMKQDPRNHAALIRAGKMTQQEADALTKQDDGYNPGGLMSGQYMPNAIQEELARKLDPSASSFFKPKSGRNNYLQLVAPPVDADGNREVTPEEAARSAALSAEIDASVKADRVRAQLQDRDKVVTNTRNPLEYAKDSTYDELDQRAAAIRRRRSQGLPVYSPDSAYEQDQNAAKAVVAGLQEENINHPIGLPLITFTNQIKKGFPNASVEERGKMVDDMMKAWNNRNKSKPNKPKSKSAPMQENTNRSMFLTHLQGMQTKSQDAQNPGLWVNGNRMPMHENTPGGGTPAGASPEEFAKARAANPFRVRLGKGRPAGAQDLNRDGLVSKAEQELIPVDLRDGDPSANHPDDTDLDSHIKRYGLDN